VPHPAFVLNVEATGFRRGEAVVERTGHYVTIAPADAKRIMDMAQRNI
jgi:hypothetical protein